MSMWTYITGCIRVYCGAKTDEESEYILKTVLNHLPKITGSNGNANIQVVNTGTVTGVVNCDEFFVPKIYVKKGYGEHYCYDEHMEYNIVISGNLRDRVQKETVKETYKFITRLSKRVSVCDGCVMIRESCYKDEDNPTIIDCKRFENMYEYEDNWCNYLRWGYYKNYSYPKELIKKYCPSLIDVEENNAKGKYNK